MRLTTSIRRASVPEKTSFSPRNCSVLAPREGVRAGGPARPSKPIQRVGLDDRIGAENQAVDDREERRVQAEAEGDGRDRGDGEHGAAREEPGAVAEVARQRVDQCSRSRVSHVVLDRLETAERQPCGALGIPERHAQREILLNEQIERGPQLIVQIALDSGALRVVAPEASDPGHVVMPPARAPWPARCHSSARLRPTAGDGQPSSGCSTLRGDCGQRWPTAK